MPRLPNAERAIIPPEKLLDYILSTEHPGGKYKAAYFGKFGYQASNYQEFEKDIRELIQTHNAIEARVSDFGTNYVVEGTLTSLSSDTIVVCTVWVILKGENIPRFVTAYPGGLR